MGFYDLSKEERQQLVHRITADIEADLQEGSTQHLHRYFSDEDTYIRKSGYQALGKIYKAEESLRSEILKTLKSLMTSDNFSIRQTTVNAAGEIGMYNFEIVKRFFDTGLFDEHHAVRNAVIGSVKKMGAKNPEPTLKWAKGYLHHQDKEIRREVCHGIELRGRTHPQDILPLLEELQNDTTARVRNTLIHVLGQIAYKKGCLETVVAHLNHWENTALVSEAIDEIVDVHERYKSFAALTQEEAIAYISQNFKNGA
ncbi:MAG: HEAT repeat domain-containing protein [Flavobacteriaceae bacterium]